MFRWFERRIHNYPDSLPDTPPQHWIAFIVDCTAGVRRYLLLLVLCAMAIGIFEAVLFSMLGRLVDWLAAVKPQELWSTYSDRLLLLAGIVLASIVVVAVWSMLKFQTLFGNFPMRLRWNFHRLMLNQSMGFFQDEFAGRVTTKVMQTALAVRDAVMTVADILVYIVIYLVSAAVVLANFDGWLLAPFLLWVVAYVGASWYFVPRLARVSAHQADARSVMTGRVTDAYTNIATVKLFSHSRREASYVRSAMQGIHAAGLCAGPADQRLRDRQPHAHHDADRRHHRARAVPVVGRPDRHRRGGGGDRDGDAPERHFTMGDVGDCRAVRAYRHGARRRVDAGASPAYRGPCRCRTVAGAARRNPLRARRLLLRLRPAGIRRLHADDPPRREGRAGGPLGRGQVDAGQPAAALL
ncbi:hypothetical protein OJJOAM_000057 [Cupriavidus sp. H18C1]